MSNIAVLCGNGLSISYDHRLRLETLSQRLHESLSEAGTAGNTIYPALKSLAKENDPGDDGDFEALLGPLDVLSTQLQGLESLTDSVSGIPGFDKVELQLNKARDFLTRLYRLGAGHVLTHIEQLTRAEHTRRTSIDKLLSDAIGAAGTHGSVCIGNLNYDSLVLSSLVSHYDKHLADMKDGRTGVKQLPIGLNDEEINGRPLRSCMDDFPGYDKRKIRLVHLHGSVTWWRDDRGGIWAIDTDQLRKHEILERWRNGALGPYRSCVVLTNQQMKGDATSAPPFSLAYDVFGKQVASADKILVVGYSFRDACVNKQLASRVSANNSLGPDSIFVATSGDDPTDNTIRSALHLSPAEFAEQCIIDRSGIPALLDKESWREWLERDNAAQSADLTK